MFSLVGRGLLIHYLTILDSLRGIECKSFLLTSILSIAMSSTSDSGSAVSLFSFASISSCSTELDDSFNRLQ